MLLAAFGNITNFETNHEFVRRVLAMDTTNFGAEPGTELDDEIMWRAITEPWMQTAAYVVIIVWEVLTAGVLLAAVVAWIRERSGGYPIARALSSVGLVMVLLLFFGGFIVIGGEWFQMWRSVEWNGLEPAFRNSVLALLTLMLIHLPSPAWERRYADA